MNKIKRIINEIIELSSKDPRVRRLVERWTDYIEYVNVQKLKIKMRADLRRMSR